MSGGSLKEDIQSLNIGAVSQELRRGCLKRGVTTKDIFKLLNTGGGSKKSAVAL